MTVELESINEGKAELLLQQQPRLGQDRAGQPYGHADAVARLQKKVLVRIWERFTYTPRKSPRGIKIVLPATK